MMLLLLAAATAAPAALQSYKDWIAGCDNIRVCQANALEPENGGENGLMLLINRGPRPDDIATLSVPMPDKATPGARYTLRVDGKIAATFTAPAAGEASVPLTGGLLGALGNGQRVALFDASGAKHEEASLAGLAAALRYIDDQQKRVGTIGALKATGPKPNSAVPAPPAVPLITVPAPSTKPPRTISAAKAAELIGSDSATCDDATGKVEPRAFRLDATHSLVLVGHPCGNGAYNFFTSVYVLDESGPPRDAQFDIPPGMGETQADGTGDLTNGDWDAKSHRLSSYEKGRGIGDCGSSETFAWDGTRFRLVEQNAMGECRGSADYIRVWTARANR